VHEYLQLRIAGRAKTPSLKQSFGVVKDGMGSATKKPPDGGLMWVEASE
jgi:hypothetical protein